MSEARAGSSGHFRLLAPPRLSRATVRRDEALRLDPDRLVAEWPSARVLVVDEKGRVPVRANPGSDAGSNSGESRSVITKAGAELAGEPPSHAVLLGQEAGTTYWAVRGRPSLLAGDDPSQWQDLRATGAELDATSAGLMVSAVAVLGWHDNAGYCARCGGKTEPRQAGWMRVCVKCGHEEYPRTDPAIICLVHDGADQVLLVRQPAWPEGRFSVLAGFVEAGESLEACVAREIEEEVGLTVSDIQYLGSQAWPFPRSIMIGFSAVADPAQPIHLADGEIAEAFWLSRAELRRSLRGGDWRRRHGGREGILLPPAVSIARTMLESWAAID